MIRPAGPRALRRACICLCRFCSLHTTIRLACACHQHSQILLYGGCLFFAACIAYQHMFGAAAAQAVAASLPLPDTGAWLLRGVVLGGALLYVFSKGAKFSLFKVRFGGPRGRATPVITTSTPC